MKIIKKGFALFTFVAFAFFISYTTQGASLQGEPVIKVNNARSITATTAVLGGSFYNAPNRLYFFYFQISSNLDDIIRYQTKKGEHLLTNYGITFQGEKKKLSPETLYYYRVVAQNEFGTAVYYSDIKSFTTQPAVISCSYLKGDWEEMKDAKNCNTSELSDYNFCQQLVGGSNEETYCCCTKENVCFSFLEIENGNQCDCTCDCDGEDQQREEGGFFDCSCDCRCYNK